jgi:hypothetical protein
VRISFSFFTVLALIESLILGPINLDHDHCCAFCLGPLNLQQNSFLNPAQSCVLREYRRKKSDLGVIVSDEVFFAFLAMSQIYVRIVLAVICISSANKCGHITFSDIPLNRS